MNRTQLEHIIRASGEIAGVQDVIILGSQAILGQFTDLGNPLFKSDRGVKKTLNSFMQQFNFRLLQKKSFLKDLT